MPNLISADPIVRSVAAELRARNFSVAADFEREAECEDCELETEMEFVMEGFEEAVAECPRCGSSVRIYV